MFVPARLAWLDHHDLEIREISGHVGIGGLELSPRFQDQHFDLFIRCFI